MPADQYDRAYRIARDALRQTLTAGVVEQHDLQDVQRAMAKLEPVAAGFGTAHYNELKILLAAVERNCRVRIVKPPEGTSMKQFLVIVGIAVAIFFAVKYHLQPAAAADLIVGPAYTIDGDTIVINNIHIRLQGLDSEEMSMTNGPRSRTEMVDIIGDQIVRCVPDGTRSYERIVASCYLPDGVDIAQALIRRDWALDCAHFSHGRYRADEPAGVRQKLYQATYC